MTQQPYRDLHDTMLGRGNEKFRPSFLFAWLERNADEVEWLRAFRERVGARDQASEEELWRLYALSRVIQLLTLSFQTGSADGSSWPGPGVTQQDLASFSAALGLAVVVPDRFSSFDCEIVTALASPGLDDPPALVEIHWPCLMLGELLVSRAGTSIRAGAGVVDARIAMSSVLYWAYRRKARPYQDLSHGWGSNSQWRTAFRRDYRVGQRVLLNVDGKHDLAAEDLVPDAEVPLTRQERTELLTHRCFVTTTKPSDDLWPYDDRLTLET